MITGPRIVLISTVSRTRYDTLRVDWLSPEQDVIGQLLTAPASLVILDDLPDLLPDILPAPTLLLLGPGRTDDAIQALERGARRIHFKTPDDDRLIAALVRSILRERSISMNELTIHNTVLKSSSDMIALRDTEGVYRLVNPAYARTAGYSVREIIGKGVNEILDPENAAHHLGQDRQVIETRQAVTYTGSLIRHDGQKRLLHVQKYPLLDSNGLCHGVIIISTDITDYDHIASALQETAYHYRQLVETTHDLILTHDMDGIITFVNQAVVRATGYSQKELLHNNILDFLTEDSRQEAALRRKNRMAGDDRTLLFEAEFIHKMGKTVPVEVQTSMIVQENQQPVMMLAARDISRRREADRALRQSEARFSQAFTSSPLAMGILRLEKQTFTEVNNRLTRLSGYTRQRLINHSLDELNLLADNDWINFISSTPLYDRETTLNTASGEKREVVFSAVPIELNEEKCIMLLLTDVTNLKNALIHQSQLELERERVQILSQFITDISHDLKHPLSIIKLNVFMLQQENQPEERRKRFLDVLEIQANHLERLLEDMLYMMRLDTRADFVFEPLDLHHIVQMVITRQSAESHRRGHTITFVPGKVLMVQADQLYLSGALDNILSNAINYTPENGNIRILTRRYEHNTRALAEIVVEDNGIGIAPEDLPHIFDRFYRADKSRQAKTGGTGLGLSIARRIIENHGGHIHAESIPDQGTRFVIRLPLSLA